jgi:predicted O-methyltransferase YrrM
MKPSLRPVGPIAEQAYSVIRDRPEFLAFQNGGARQDFAAFLDRIAPDLIAAGLPPEDVHFAKRYPESADSFVRQALLDLRGAGIIRSADHDAAHYRKIVEEMGRYYSHGHFRTYIYPEEAQLLYALTAIEQPRRAIFLGSYYGYWAHPAILAIARSGGSAVLVDPDPSAQDIARSNVTNAGIAGSVEIVVATGQQYLSALPDGSPSFDLVVLDAETPRDHPDPRQRGKRIYEPLFEAVLPHTRPGALLVCHNILFTDIAACDWFDTVIERNHAELDPFLALVQRTCGQFSECTSTEGVGVGRVTHGGNRP